MKNSNTNENTYVKKVSYNPKSPLNDMRTFAIENNVPIIGDEVLRFLEMQVTIKKPKSILEVGTAIGYSTVAMLLNSEAGITSIEKDEKSYEIAKSNIKKMGFEKRAKLILGDASEVLLEMGRNKDRHFDFVFVDASKAHYLEHFKLIENMLMNDAVVIFDNVMYLGLIAGRRSINRNKTIRYRMQGLIDYCFDNPRYKVSLLQAEDGLLLLYKR